jgi:uncharacterized membrane protein
MIRFFARPLPLVLLLAFATFIPVLSASVQVVQIPLGILPEESLRLAIAPYSHFLHALAGLLFGLLGPLQFARMLRGRFGPLHRLSGRVFVVAGAGMALSGLSLLWQIENVATSLLVIARAVFSAALIVALMLGVYAARVRNKAAHRAWMIRAYAVGMGGPTVALVMFPIYLAGGPVTGPAADLVFVGWWLVTIAIGEWVIRLAQHKEALA